MTDDTTTTTTTTEDQASLDLVYPSIGAAPRTPLAEPSSEMPVVARDPQVFFAMYVTATGAVRVTGHCPSSMLKLQKPKDGEAVFPAWVDDLTQYVDITKTPPVAAARPTIPAFDKSAIKADGTDAATLQLPIAATVTIDDVDHQVAAGPLVFTADTAGTYAVSIKQFPYQDFSASVVAA